MKYRGWPEPGDLVVGTVTEIEDFGVFVDLEQYEEKEGLVHISDVASGWIKNIGDHVSVGQRVVCQVTGVDKSAHQIDLSIKDINDHQHKETIQSWKNEQRADTWLSRAFEETNKDEEAINQIAEHLVSEFSRLYDAFEAAATRGPEALDDTDLDEDEIEAIVEIARESVSVPYVEISGYVDLESVGANGVDDIKSALQAAEGNGEVGEDVEIEVSYVGAPEYRILVQAPDYKLAESALERSAERAIAAIADRGGDGEFHRERRDESE